MLTRLIRAGSNVGIALALLTLTGAAAVGQREPADPFEQTARRCTLFEHTEFGGESRDVAEGEAAPWLGDKWNDRISSIRCHRRCRAIVYEHINRAGQSARFGPRSAFLGAGWNDRISGVEVSCAARGERRARLIDRPPRASCTFYADAGHRGESITVARGEDGSWVGNRWNDRISSFTCRPGCSAEIFEHIRFGGASAERVAADALDSWWNDRISSLRVICRLSRRGGGA